MILYIRVDSGYTQKVVICTYNPLIIYNSEFGNFILKCVHSETMNSIPEILMIKEFYITFGKTFLRQRPLIYKKIFILFWLKH